MNLKVGDQIVINPDYYRKKEIPTHTLRGVIKEVKWNMFQVRFDNGAIEWIDSKSVMPVRVYDTLTSKT